MTSMASRLRRAIVAVPFLLVAAWCFQAMDLEKIDANAQPYAKSGVIQWDDNEISILDNFHGVPILDEIWRGSMATLLNLDLWIRFNRSLAGFLIPHRLGTCFRYLDLGVEPWGQCVVACVQSNLFLRSQHSCLA